ncbi:MAG TPA: hypothetical protein PK597_05335 [Oscillospiraceae bacterium]|nr:hypothetical protein [Oscillospiraceae bacterium]
MKDANSIPAEIFSSPEAANILRNKAAIAALLTSPEGKRLMQLLDEAGGAQDAAMAAAGGNPAALVNLLGNITRNPEGAALLQRISSQFNK